MMELDKLVEEGKIKAYVLENGKLVRLKIADERILEELRKAGIELKEVKIEKEPTKI